MAVTWFCLSCFAEVEDAQRQCPNCGVDLTALDSESLDERLVRALGHRLAGRRIVVAQVLGNRRAASAVPALAEVAIRDDDPFVAAEAVRALVRIGTDNALAAARTVATWGSVVPRRAARAALGLDRSEPGLSQS
jgi:HEAT repeat protein